MAYTGLIGFFCLQGLLGSVFKVRTELYPNPLKKPLAAQRSILQISTVENPLEAPVRLR